MKGLGSISNNHGNTSSKAFAQEKNMKIDQKIQNNGSKLVSYESHVTLLMSISN